MRGAEHSPNFYFRSVMIDKTTKLISSLAKLTTLGHDLIDSIALKSVVPFLIHPLNHIINMSLLNSKFARKWKFARLTPHLKSKDMDRTDTSTYRPVAVLTTTSKLVERAAQQQLLGFLERTHQLNASSHAYRSNLSTTTTLTEILDEIHQGTESKKITSLMTLDQSAAFDCVSHRLLLDKARKYNIGLEAVEWLKDYLVGRTQYVVIGGGGGSQGCLQSVGGCCRVQ